MKRMILVLTLVTLASGIVLAAVYTGLIDRIQENQRLAIQRSLGALFEGAEQPSFAEISSDGPVVYRATSSTGDLLGYAARVTTTGYGGEIRLLVGLDPDASTIIGIQVVEQIETPGLGGRITEDSFQEQFEGLDPTQPISYVKNAQPEKDANEIQAISGATISSEAVVTGINEDIGQVFHILDEEDATQ